jgi:hypothetical protein
LYDTHLLKALGIILHKGIPIEEHFLHRYPHRIGERWFEPASVVSRLGVIDDIWPRPFSTIVDFANIRSDCRSLYFDSRKWSAILVGFCDEDFERGELPTIESFQDALLFVCLYQVHQGMVGGGDEADAGGENDRATTKPLRHIVDGMAALYYSTPLR